MSLKATRGMRWCGLIRVGCAALFLFVPQRFHLIDLFLLKPVDFQRYLIRDHWKNASTPSSCCLTLLSSNHVSEKPSYSLSFPGILMSIDLSLSKIPDPASQNSFLDFKLELCCWLAHDLYWSSLLWRQSLSNLQRLTWDSLLLYASRTHLQKCVVLSQHKNSPTHAC